MTYYLKYLKYKNKYLELKNMIAGKGPLDEVKLKKIWQKREAVKKVYEVTKDVLIPHYSQYCWVSQTTKEGKAPKANSKYGGGFFLYSLKDDAKPFEGHVQHGKYAIWYITENDIGEVGIMNPPVPSSFFENSFKTTFNLPYIGIGKDFDWHNEHDCWIYNTKPEQRTYELKLKLKSK